MPGFFDIAYKPSPLLKRVADLPIYGDKAELAQFDGAYKIAEIDIPEVKPGPQRPPRTLGVSGGSGSWSTVPLAVAPAPALARLIVGACKA